MFAICDMAREHLLTKNLNWAAMPIDEDDIERLVIFKDQDRPVAEAYAIAASATGLHCRPYALAE